jgi:hypothetical protein
VDVFHKLMLVAAELCLAWFSSNSFLDCPHVEYFMSRGRARSVRLPAFSSGKHSPSKADSPEGAVGLAEHGAPDGDAAHEEL